MLIGEIRGSDLGGRLRHQRETAGIQRAKHVLGRYRLQLFEVVSYALGFFGFLASAP